MADEAMEAADGSAHRDVKAELDERRIARAVAIGLPLVTAILALVTGMTMGTPMAILVMASGVLLGVIALFWASLRILSGDAALSPELEALDATAHAVDALASRKKMLVRALKDLENERALGKLEEDDFEQLSHTYRGELKEVLTRIDASLEPHRPKAEDAARAYLAKAGLAEEARKAPASKVAPEAPESEPEDDEDEDEDEEDATEEVSEPVVAAKAETKPAKKSDAPTRVACTKCKTSNEVDASFCKKCGASLAKEEVSDET
jgi:ribosomal protein L40E